jgi:predicted nucleic acid-binding protein
MGVERSEQALEDLADLPLHRYPHDIFLAESGLQRNLTAHDAAYLALAAALDAPLITRDAALARVPGHYVHVELRR